jgi:putative heme-binding domain-containing protein
MEKLRFPAPSEPGDYPYLCSFPAHWLTMNGVMTVVKPGDAKAGEIVRGKPPGEALPPIVELLAMRGNADAGKAVFTRTCAICHKLGDTGVNFAPHLNQIAARLTREQIIKSILEPGAEITKGNETVTIEAADGETYTGLIGEETAGQIKLRVGADAVQTIPKAAILKRETAKNSGMPLGLEQAMSRQEFVDLIEFLAAQK